MHVYPERVSTVWRKQKNGLQYRGYDWAQRGAQHIGGLHSEFGTGDYSLHISKVRVEDGGVYTCSVKDSDRHRLSLKVVTLRVINVEGGNVSITCTVTPWPRDAVLEWTLNKYPFVPQHHSGVNEKVILNGDDYKTVIMGKATQTLTGDWACVVQYHSEEGRAAMSLSTNGITHPPNDNTKVYAAVGSAVTLPCVFAAGLTPSDPVWLKLNISHPPSTSSVPPSSFNLSTLSSQHPSDQSFYMSTVGFEDEGRYRCSGTVGGCRLSRDLQLVVAKVDSNMPSIRRAPVTLTCHLSDPSEVTKYEWVYVTYDLNGTQSVSSIQEGKVLSISKAADDNSGEWACRFYGTKGVLGNVTYHIPLISSLTGDSVSTSNNTATVIGLSFLLLVMLMILAQMYKNHQRRKRIFQYPALETIVHAISYEREERERNRAHDSNMSK
ncbi:cell adhesion molecule CEACAM2 [Diretmus argenteus]